LLGQGDKAGWDVGAVEGLGLQTVDEIAELANCGLKRIDGRVDPTLGLARAETIKSGTSSSERETA
jgi:hypothetical protein